MRKAFVFFGVLACVALDVRGAHAQDKKDSGKIHTRDEVQNSGNAERARARVRQGDCAGALDLFDAALRTSMDPSVKRDRGLCHEELGHPYPAIEDYRAYLTEASNAKDFDQIRERLERLEASAAHAPSEGEANAKYNPELGGDKASAAGMVTGEAPLAVTVSTTGKDKDTLSPEAVDASDPEARDSPLRRGKGFALGAYFAGRESGFGSSNAGSGYGIGAALRQSFSRVSTVVMDVGYSAYKLGGNVSAPGATATTGVSGNTLDGTPLRGFALLVGYEARFALDARTTNAILLGGGLEWNRLAVSNGPSLSVFFPRGRAGFRHVFGPSLGLETSLEVSKPLPAGSNATDFETFQPFRAWKESLMFGVQVAIVTGF